MMSATSERDELRKIFFASWQKHQLQLPVEPLEVQLIEIILLHPELHELLNQPENFLAENFGSANPFLHLSLHLALREQVGTNRPPGIQKIYAKLCRQFNDVHLAEHHMLDCLEEILWIAQKENKNPDEQRYFEMLSRL
jgi:hypothetical protein